MKSNVVITYCSNYNVTSPMNLNPDNLPNSKVTTSMKLKTFSLTLKFFINATLFIIYCSIVIHNIHLYASFDQLLFIIHIDIHILLLQLNSASLIHTNNFIYILKPTSTTCRPMHFHKITLKFLYKVSSHLALIAYEVSFHLASLASIAYFKGVSMLMFQLLQTILYLVFLHN